MLYFESIIRDQKLETKLNLYLPHGLSNLKSFQRHFQRDIPEDDCSLINGTTLLYNTYCIIQGLYLSTTFILLS